MISKVAEDTKVKTAVPPHGHWRNKFWSADGWTKCDPGAIHLDKNTCIIREQFLSEAEAQRGASILMHAAEDPADVWYDPKSVLVYLGAVFFQEG